MRIGTLLIIIFIITIITIQLYAFLELYKKLKNKAKHKNAINSANNTDRPKNAISIETLDLDKLKFDSYLREFNKTYNQEEYMRRFKNFKVSLEEILNLNLIKLENKTIYGLTKYSDMSKEEFQFDSYLRNFKTNKGKTDIDVDVLDLDKLRFDIYLRDFDKTYNKEEYQRRFKNFKASLTDIARLNKLENNKVFGLTKFSDMSKEEFAERMLLKPIDIAPCNPAHPRSCSKPQIQNKPSRNKKNWNDIPKSFDWRTRKGFVKPVLNQKECQGCWAFGIVGVMETMAAIQLNDTRSRSIQELLDCSAYNHGCNKGSVSEAMLFMCRHQLQFVTEEEYPMKLPIEKECRQAIDTFRGIRVKRYDHTCNMDENLMVEDIYNHGPLIAAVDSWNWPNYIGGVITRACTAGVANHVIQIVGYEGYNDNNTLIPYYIVRNSFGEDWGDQGYVKVAMKHKDLYDVCGIADQVTKMDVCDPNRPEACL